MAEEKAEQAEKNEQNEKAAVKPNEETLQTTDPEKHMKGPLSSIIGKIAGNSDEPETSIKKSDNN